MFTGIIQSTGKLRNEANQSIIEVLENNFEMNIGDSIAVDGICLTVKDIFQNSFSVDVSEETLKKTTLGKNYSSKKIVNLEPALRISDRLGGHIVSGHVDGLGEVVNIEKLDKSWLLSIKWQNKKYSKYIVNKGSVCVNGISLTIASNKNDGEVFSIAIIPHTWQNTNLQFLSLGQVVNLEADALIKYVEKLLYSKEKECLNSKSEEITPAWLNSNGWNN